VPYSINTTGVIAGDYVDASGVSHGFVRSATGTIASFDPPGAQGALGGTFAPSINKAGVITGSYSGADGVDHGFERIP
jgi:hypothetical protein